MGRIISGGFIGENKKEAPVKLPKPIIQQPGEQEQINTPEESYGQRAKRVATATGVGALQNIENLLTAPGRFLLGKEPPFATPVEQIKESYNLTPEYLQPQGTAESAIQRYGSQAPLAVLLGGGLGLKALGAGTVAATGAQLAGLPEETQNLAQIVAEVPYSIYKGIKSGKFPTAATEQKSKYNLAKLAVNPSEKIAAEGLINAVGSVAKELETEVNKDLAGKIRGVLGKIEDNILNGKLNPIKGMSLRKSLYKIANKLNPDEAATYIEPLTKAINEMFANYAVNNPTFYKHLKSADKLTALRHITSSIENLITAADLKLVPGGKLVSNLLIKFLGTGEKALKGLITNPEAGKLYLKMAGSLIGNDPLQAVRYANLLQKKLPSNLQVKTTEEAPVKRAKFLSGGFK